MKSTDAKAYKLLMLMSDFSKILDQEHAITHFMEAFHRIWPGLHCRIKKDVCAEAPGFFPIESGDIHGCLTVDEFDALSEEDRALISSAVSMLEIVLEKLSLQSSIILSPIFKASDNQHYVIYNSHDVTIEREAESALRESEEKYRLLIEHLSEGIWFIDKNANTTYVNQRMAEMLGYSVNEMAGMHLFEFMDERGREIAKSKLKERTQGIGEQHEFEFIRKDGERIYTLLETTPVFDENKQYIGAIAGVLNITNRIRTEEALRSSEQKFKTLYQNSPYGIVICRILRNNAGDAIDFVHLECNRATADNTGFNLDELIGKKASEIVDPETQQDLTEKYEHVVTSGEPLSYEQYFDIYNRTLQVVVFALEDDRFIINFIDITEQEEAKNALRESEAFKETLLNNTPDIIYIYDIAEKKNVYTNNGIMRILGYSVDEIQTMGNRVVRNLMHEEDFEVYIHDIIRRYQKLKDDELLEHTYRMKHKDGTWRWLQSKESVYQRTKNGKPIRIFGIISDITKNVESENEIKEYINFLDSTMEHSPFAMWIADPSGNVIRTNAALRRWLKLNDDQIIGKYNVLEDKNLNKQGVMPLVKKVFSGNQPARFDIPWSGGVTGIGSFKEAASLWIDVSMFPVTNEDGSLQNVVCQWIDITERKKILKELQDRNAYIESILENMPIGFALNTIDDGDVKYMNNRFEDIYGWSREVLSNVSIFFEKVFPDPGLREEIKAKIVADMQSGDPERMRWNDLKIVTSSGEERYVYAFNIPLLDQNLMMSTVQDVTARKKAEDRTRSSLAEKETLLRELYHRTKNNMNIIQSMLTLQMTLNRNPDLKRIISETNSKIQSMALVHQKLYQSQDLSRIRLHEYIPELADLLRQSYTTSTSMIEIKLNVEPISVVIDVAIPCGLILNELLSNSFKHAFPNERGGEISISLTKNDPGQISLHMTDNGVGVPPGFDFYNQETLGLQSILMIAEHQLQGTVQFSGEGGFSCRVQFTDTTYQARI